jgi:hypothetical protein
LASPRDSSSAAGWNRGLRFDDFLPGMVLDMGRSKNSKPSTFDVVEYRWCC